MQRHKQLRFATNNNNKPGAESGNVTPNLSVSPMREKRNCYFESYVKLELQFRRPDTKVLRKWFEYVNQSEVSQIMQVHTNTRPSFEEDPEDMDNRQ